MDTNNFVKTSLTGLHLTGNVAKKCVVLLISLSLSVLGRKSHTALCCCRTHGVFTWTANIVPLLECRRDINLLGVSLGLELYCPVWVTPATCGYLNLN